MRDLDKDIEAAKQAYKWGLLEPVGDDSLDDYIAAAFEDVNDNYPPWKFPGNTCQDAAKDLIDRAKKKKGEAEQE